MKAPELLVYVDRAGGRVWLERGRLKYRLPNGRTDLLEKLKANRDALIGHLKAVEPACHITRLESGLTVWNLLRGEWRLLLTVLRESQDTEGRITVYTPDGGEVVAVSLDQPPSLAESVRELISKYPDPLEVVVYAIKGDHIVLRSRQRRSMILGRVAS